MDILTFTDALWAFIGLAALWFYGLIGAWIGYRRHKTFYRHCNDKEDEYPVVCYLITVFFWPLRFPYDRARTGK